MILNPFSFSTEKRALEEQQPEASRMSSAFFIADIISRLLFWETYNDSNQYKI